MDKRHLDHNADRTRSHACSESATRPEPALRTERARHDEPAARTELIFILDASGSMSGLEDDTVGGFNAMLAEHRDGPGEAIVSTLIFNDHTRVLHDRVDVRSVEPLTRNEYRCSGCTALLDAVGGAIDHVDLVQRVQPAGYEADKVLFVITTDGMENARSRYSYREVKQLIERQREKGWEFIFIGANIDVAREAERLGIDCDCAVGYVHDEVGTNVMYRAASCAARMVRCSESLEAGAWRRELDEDVRRRGR